MTLRISENEFSQKVWELYFEYQGLSEVQTGPGHFHHSRPLTIMKN
jgi:hypothetical protein